MDPNGNQIQLDPTEDEEIVARVAAIDVAKDALTRAYAKINPAAVQREIQALTAELLVLTTAKAAARAKPTLPKRASGSEATTRAIRAS